MSTCFFSTEERDTLLRFLDAEIATAKPTDSVQRIARMDVVRCVRHKVVTGRASDYDATELAFLLGMAAVDAQAMHLARRIDAALTLELAP